MNHSRGKHRRLALDDNIAPDYIPFNMKKFLAQRVSRTTLRSIFLIALLGLANVAFIYHFAPELTSMTTWLPDDYQKYFLPWGLQARDGIYNYRYPLPTLMWVFVPLSFVPPGWILLWVAMPFLFLLYLFGKKGIILWLSFPFLDHAAFGQMDGWLIVPLAWLFDDNPALAGISAALLTLKPQLALLPVSYMFVRWLIKRNYKSLGLFGGALCALYIPTFLLDPSWPLKMWADNQVRAAEPTLLTRGASLWPWWWHGGWTQVLLPFLCALIALFFLLAARTMWKRARAIHLVALMTIPIFYPVSFVTIAPALKNSTRHLVVFTLTSWIAVLLDIVTQGWGGVYLVIPLVALALLAHDPAATLDPFPAPFSLRHPTPQ